MHFADGFSSKIFMMIFFLTSWRPCVTLVSSLNNFRPVSLKMSRCSSTSSNYRSKTATIKKQYHINRVNLQRKTAQFLSNDGAMSTVSEDVDADLFYDEAANSLLTSGLFDYDNSHLQHLTTDGSQITDYWIHKLSQLPVGAAKTLISQIVPDNSVGYVGLTGPAKSNTLVAYYIDQKISHPDKIILMRNGEFYETFGIDSLMLIAYAGLNPMGGKAKAGCPIQNVQATLDGLTRQGFSIAVYEESPITQDDDSGVKKRIKARYLSQIVFPGAKTYTHNLSLRQDNIDFQENSPVIGIMKTAGGYMMIEVYLDEEIIEVSERLTLETVRVLAKGGFVQPVYLNGDVKKDILGDDVRYEILSGYSEIDFADQVLRKFSINDLSTAKVSSFKKRRKSYLNGPRPVYISTALQIGLLKNPNVPPLIPHLLPKRHSPHSSRFLTDWISQPPSRDLADHMRSLCELLMNTNLPLMKSLQVKKVVSLLSAEEGNLALFKEIRDTLECVLSMLLSTRHVWDVKYKPRPLKGGKKGDTSRTIPTGMGSDLGPLLPHLLAITTSECGLDTNPKDLTMSCIAILDLIKGSIAGEEDESNDVCTTDIHNRIPKEFFIYYEESFRNQLSRRNVLVDKMHRELESAASVLMKAVKEDYPVTGIVKHDLLNNLLCFTEGKKTSKGGGRKKVISSVSIDIDSDSDGDGEDEVAQQKESNSLTTIATPTTAATATATAKSMTEEFTELKKKSNIEFYHPLDKKHGKPMATKWTTKKVDAALTRYLDVTERSIEVTRQVLKTLSADVYGNVDGIKQAAAWSVILQAASDHTVSACQKNWCIPELLDFIDTDLGSSDSKDIIQSQSVQSRMTMSVKGISPYWIDRSKAVHNDFELNGLFLLTAPNMSGKSTLMRTILVAALLANCGLFTPCTSAKIPRYDHFFLRTSSHDIPSEGKSAFAVEMEDMRIILDDSTHRSLIMIDELGKGTSARDGAALASSLLENLDDKKVSGIFATHLHELFLLPLYLPNTKNMRMEFSESSGRLKWTYKLKEGSCTNSHALETAHTYGIPSSIIERAQTLGRVFDEICRPDVLAAATLPSTSSAGARRSICVSASVDAELTAYAENATNDGTSWNQFDPSSTVSYDPPSASKGAALRYYMDDVSEIFKEHLSGQVLTLRATVVEADQQSPPAYEGSSCVYLLILQRENQPDTIYIGETESISQRLQQHRSNFKDASVGACIASVSNKSFARRMESDIQMLFKQKGYSLESDTDSKHTLFSNSGLDGTR